MKLPPSFVAALVTLLAAGAPVGTLAQRAANPAFAPVEDDPDLPRVLLVGDSISIGYTLPVRERLAGIANVHRVPANAGDTGRGLEQLSAWLETLGGKWDLVHFNFGLHDLCYRHPDSPNPGRRDKERGAQAYGVEEYAANLGTIADRLAKTGARLVFATTTPVPEGELGRVAGDELRYNEAAVAAMRTRGVEINDLHRLMAGEMERYGKGPGNVHFTDEGSERLAAQVAGAIAEALAPEREGRRVLFDGGALEPIWHFPQPGGWEIEADGSMVCRVKEGTDRQGRPRMVSMGDIWTHLDYDDFELRLSYKLSEAANSGVFYRANPRNPVQDGLEIQLMDDEGFQRGRETPLEARKLNASFYDGKAPSKDAAKPLGEWNDFVLRCEGPRIRVVLNGEEVIDLDIDDWDTPGRNPDGTENKFARALKDFPRRGRVGFQNHGQVVWFREVSILRLDGGD